VGAGASLAALPLVLAAEAAAAVFRQAICPSTGAIHSISYGKHRRPLMKPIKRFLLTVFFMGSFFTGQAAYAGIPVIDAAAIAHAYQQVLAWGQQYGQMVDQLTKAQKQIENTQKQIDITTGTRNLGNINNNLGLQKIVPNNTAQVFSGINSGGYNALTSNAKSLRDQTKKYNCEDRTGEDLMTCQAILNNNAQAQAYQQDALDLATQRTDQIQSLQDQINSTDDPKAIAELQARIAAENTQVANDANRIALMQALAQSKQQEADQAHRERWLNLMQKDTPTAAASFTYHQ
jgi:type IV secretion system protein VirB5